MLRFAMTTALAVPIALSVALAQEAGKNTTGGEPAVFTGPGDGQPATGDFYTAEQTQILATTLLGVEIVDGVGDDADTVGEVVDLVLSADGRVIAVLVPVGGFLGIGEKDVALAMGRLRWKTSADGSRRLVADLTDEELDQAPEFDKEVVTAAATRLPTRPRLTFKEAGLQASDILGMRVEGAGGEEVGEVTEILLAENGAVEAFIVDVGGFLGIGSKLVAVAFDNLSVSRTEEGGAFTVIHTSLSAEQLEDQPAYDAAGYQQDRERYTIKPVFQ